MSKIRKPRVSYYGYENGWYGRYDAKRVIEGYLTNDEELMSRRNAAGNITRRLNLSEIFNTYADNVIPFDMNGYGRYQYWATKTPENLTEEDKSFLRWVLRKGRLRDAPTRDQGVKIISDKGLDTRKE